MAIPIAALWLVNALWLGRRQELFAARSARKLAGRAAPQWKRPSGRSTRKDSRRRLRNRKEKDDSVRNKVAGHAVGE